MEGSAVVCAAWQLSSLNQEVLGSNPAKFFVEMLPRGAKKTQQTSMGTKMWILFLRAVPDEIKFFLNLSI